MFGETSDEVHEFFSYQVELNKFAEFNFGNSIIILHEDFKAHIKKKFGD